MNDGADIGELAVAVDLVAAAEELRPLVERHAAEATRERMLPPIVVEALRRSGIFSGAVPRALGGSEADPIVQMMTTETLARADCSAAWCSNTSRPSTTASPSSPAALTSGVRPCRR